MVIRRWTVWWTGLAGIVLLAACSRQAAAPARVEQSQATVDAVEVAQVIGGHGELFALVRGSLPDGCAQLQQPVVNSGGRLVVVILPQIRAAAEDCPPGPLPFERTIPLGKDLPPGQYTVSVNGTLALFDLQAEPAAVPTLPAKPPPTVESPTTAPTPAEAAVQPEAPLSEETPTQEAPLPEEAPTPTSAPTREPTPSPTPAPAASAAGCEDKAAFFADISVPDGTLFEPGETFTKTWRIRNAGTCTWEGYALIFQQGNRLGSPDPAPIRAVVSPGQTVEISLAMTAPQAPGSYFSDWLFANSAGSIFGLGNPPVGLLWTKIGVRSQAPPGGGELVCAYTGDASVEAEILALINEARQERDLSPLTVVPALSTAARAHSQDMACNDFVSHYGYSGSTWYDRIQAQGARYRNASENIYAGSPQFGGTAQGAFTWWMNSQVHRDNILNPKARQIGIGYAFVEQSTYKGYYTLNFVEP